MIISLNILKKIEFEISFFSRWQYTMSTFCEVLKSKFSVHLYIISYDVTETNRPCSLRTGPKLVYNTNKPVVTRGKTKRDQEPLQTRPWRWCLQGELLLVQRGCRGGCGLHTAQGHETSLLSAVSVVPTEIKDANEKGRLAEAGWLAESFTFPLLLVVRDGWCSMTQLALLPVVLMHY